MFRAAIGKLRDMHKTIARTKEVHKGTKVHHLDDFTFVNFIDFRLSDNGMDPFTRCINFTL